MHSGAFLAIILWAKLCTPARAAAPDQVTWIVEKFEPRYALDGKRKDPGAAGSPVALLQRDMPENKWFSESSAWKHEYRKPLLSGQMDAQSAGV